MRCSAAFLVTTPSTRSGSTGSSCAPHFGDLCLDGPLLDGLLLDGLLLSRP